MNWQQFFMPLAAGMNQKADDRALKAPELASAIDVQFDELGGLQTRKPFASYSVDIFGGGTMSDIRRIFTSGDELLCLTANALYSWNAHLELWVSKGTHLAVKVDESTKFSALGDQHDGDRAELSSTVVYTWTNGTLGYVAAVDKTTGSVLMAPHSIGAASRLRVVALTTKILLTFCDSLGEWYCYALDPAAPATALAGSSTTIYNTGTSANVFYDVVKIPLADAAMFVGRFNATTSYLVAKITAGLTVTTSIKARTCDECIALSCEPTGTSVQVARTNAGAIVGDFITISSLADVTINQAIGTTSGNQSQLTMAHRSTQDSSAYRCYVFWTKSGTGTITTGEDLQVKYNWVDTAGALGAEAVFVNTIGLGSRAFTYSGYVYVCLLFGGESMFDSQTIGLQNTYYLYRDDKLLAAKAVTNRAAEASYAVTYPQTQSRLPGVATAGSATVFAFCADQQRAFETRTDGLLGFSSRTTTEVTFTFDSDECRRVARLGETLYITSGEGLLQYDGVGLYEVGFHQAPWYLTVADGAGGSIATGSYSYKPTLRWSNAKGDRERSTSSSLISIPITGADGTTINVTGLYATRKTPTIEVWRTAKDPTDDSPFFLVTSPDPIQTSNPNPYITNDPTAIFQSIPMIDGLVDADITSNEANPENGSVLENLPPPPCTILVADGERLFLAGVSGDHDRVWYSKQRNAGEVAAFHDALTINIPPGGGAITALEFLNETLIVFRETAIYALPGNGYDNLGGGQNFGPARTLSNDCGAISAETVALTPTGLIFKSSKGWYVLNRGWGVDYIGAPVSDYDAETVVAVHVVETQHQIRCLTTLRMLVFDYLVSQWAEWTIDADAASATLWNGAHVYANADAVLVEQPTLTNLDYGMDLETAWIPMGNLQGAGRVRWFELIGEYLTAFHMRVRVAYDYECTSPGVPAWVDDHYWAPSPTTVGSVLQVRHSPTRGRCQAIKIRLTAVSAADHAVAPTGGAAKLTGLTFELGFDRGINRRLPAAQKQ